MASGVQPLLVSIIIPCWNAEDCVGEAIESALAQTYPAVEVVVVDDGSTDGSLDVVKSFGKRVRWKTGPNGGGCAARNRGLEMAKGDLVQFLDADDILFPNKLERSVPSAVAAGKGLMVVCDWETEDPKKNPSLSTNKLGYQDEDPVAFMLCRQLPTPSPLHWTVNLQRVGGFDVSLPCSQERDLHLRLSCAGVRLQYLPEMLFRVRRRQDSVSSKFVRILEQHHGIFSRAFKILEASGGMSDARRAAYAAAFAKDGRLSVRFGRNDLATAYFATAEEILPGATVEVFRDPVLRMVAKRLGPAAAERLCRVAISTGLRR